MKKILFLLISMFISTNSVSPTHLRGTYNELPEEYKHYSPLHGAIVVESGIISNMYDDGFNAGLTSGAAMHSLISNNNFGLFHKVPNDPNLKISYTQGNPTVALSKDYSLYADLAIFLYINRSDEFRQNIITKLQKALNNTTSKNLRNRIKLFLNTLQKCVSEEKQGIFPEGTTLKILLGHLYIQQSDGNEPFLKYAKRLKELNSQINIQLLEPFDFDKEGSVDNPEWLVFRTIASLGVPNIAYSQGIPNACEELSILNLLNCLFYNFETNRFDASLLNCQPTIQLKEFYEKIQPTAQHVLQRASIHAWLEYVRENLRSSWNPMTCSEKNNVPPRVRVMLKVISTILNLDIKNFKDLANLSNSDRKIDVEMEIDGEFAQIRIKISDLKTRNLYSLNISSNSDHTFTEITSENRLAMSNHPLLSEFNSDPLGTNCHKLAFYSNKIYKTVETRFTALLNSIESAQADANKLQKLKQIIENHIKKDISYSVILNKTKDSLINFFGSHDTPSEYHQFILDIIKNIDEGIISSLLKDLGISTNDYNRRALQKLINYVPELLKFSKSTQESELITAIKLNEINVVKKLIELGADVNRSIYYTEVETPLKVAIEKSNLKITKILLKHSAVVNGPITHYNQYIRHTSTDSHSHLERAVKTGNLKIIQLLKDYGGDLFAVNSKGQNLLFFAKKPEVVQYLLEKGLALDVQDNTRNTPLHMQAYREVSDHDILVHHVKFTSLEIIPLMAQQNNRLLTIPNHKKQTPLDILEQSCCQAKKNLAQTLRRNFLRKHAREQTSTEIKICM